MNILKKLLVVLAGLFILPSFAFAMKQPILGSYNDNLNVDSATTEYNMLMGGYTWTNSESQRREVIPTAGKLRKLYVHLSADPANAGSSYTFTVMVNGSASTLTVTIAAGSTSGSDLAHELTLAAGDYVSLRAVASATDPVAVTAAWATEFESDTAGESIVMGLQGTSNTTTYYGELGGRYQNADETLVNHVMPTAGTFKKLYVILSGDPGTAPDDYTIALRVNAATKNNSVTVVADNTTGHDTAHTDAVAAGNLVDLVFIPENTPSVSPYIGWGMVFVSDTDGESLIFGGTQDVPSVSSAEYYYLGAQGISAWTSTEANVYSVIQAFELKKMYVHLTAAPGSGKHQVISINSPGNTATGLSVDIMGTATSGNDTVHTYTPADGDVIDLKSSPSGTPTAAIVRVGLVAYLSVDISAGGLQDNFNDNSLDGTKWVKVEVASATVQETNGTIVITPAASTASSEGVLVSYPAWTATKDLTGSEFVINLKQALNASANAQTYFYVVKDDNNWLSFAIEGATRLLYANGAVAGTPYYDLAHATYNASTMQWLRIREYNGNVNWEYSADRLTWTQLFTVANPFAITAVYPKVRAVANNVATPGTAIFDNFNVYPNVAITGTLLTAGTVPSSLGFDFFASADNTDPDPNYSTKLDALYAAGIRHLRIGLAAYSDATSTANTKTVAAAAVAKGFNVVFGITVGEYITSSNWSDYVTAAESAATWAQANGIYEFQLGNEEEWHVDGTTMTVAQLITNMKSLATSVQAIFTNGNVSYAIANSYISDWVTAGRGDIDLIACNIYMFNDVGPEIWKSLVDSLYTAWGADHSYLSEFAPDSYSLNHYSTDETVQAAATSAYIDYLRSKGYSRYFFFMYYDDARPGGPAGFGALKTDSTYRKLWNVLLAQTLSAEGTIVSGGKTIILTLTNDTWVASGATFDGQRQNIINGLDSAQAEGTGWDAEVKAKIAVTDVVRTSDTVVTITLDAEAGYSITANELITATVPSTALVGGTALVAYPNFGVANTAAVSSHLKTWNGILWAHIKTINGIPIANIKSWNGIQ